MLIIFKDQNISHPILTLLLNQNNSTGKYKGQKVKSNSLKLIRDNSVTLN